MPCGWVVKTGMAHSISGLNVWIVEKLCENWTIVNTCHTRTCANEGVGLKNLASFEHPRRRTHAVDGC